MCSINLKSHCRCWRQNVCSNLCASSRALIIAEIPMIVCIHIPWVVPENSAKFWPNCSRFREMVAILIEKNHIFALFSQYILVIPTKLSLGKWLHFKGKKIAFLHFFWFWYILPSFRAKIGCGTYPVIVNYKSLVALLHTKFEEQKPPKY